MNLSKSTILIVSLFILAGAISWATYLRDYTQSDTVNIHLFPNRIGEWTAEEMPMTEREYAVLETRNTFSRKYSTPDGKAVYLFIVYSQTNRKVAHPPEVCYTGGGATLVSNVHRDIPGVDIAANKVLVEMGLYQQYMYYWFKVGETFTSNYWKQQALIAANTLFGKPAGSALVRLSADIKSDNQEQAAQDIEEFTREIVPLLKKYLP